jgi:hypothetical protein
MEFVRVEASATLDMALVLTLTSSPSPSFAGRFANDQHLADEVVQDFDATHRLSKLFAAWANLSVGAASFGELLQVDAFSFFSPFDLVFLVSFFLLIFLLCVRPSHGTSLAFLALVKLRRNWSLR